jgi:TonB family protein
MTPVTGRQFMVATLVAAVAHGGILTGMVLEDQVPPKAAPEPLVFLELAAMGDEFGELDPTAPIATTTGPDVPVDPNQLPTPQDQTALPTTPTRPELAVTETVPPEDVVEEDPLEELPPDLAEPVLPEPPPPPELAAEEMLPPEELLDEDPLEEVPPDLAEPDLPEPPPPPELAAVEMPPTEDRLEIERPEPLPDLAIEPDVLPDVPDRPEMMVAELQVEDQRIEPVPLPEELDLPEPAPAPLAELDIAPPPPEDIELDTALLDPQPLPEPPPLREAEPPRLDDLPPPPERKLEREQEFPDLTVAALSEPPKPEIRRPITEALPKLEPRRDPLAELPKPRRKPAPKPRPDVAPPEQIVAAASPPRDVALTPAPAPQPTRNQVASAPAVVQPAAVAPARRGATEGDARAKYASNVHQMINARATRYYPAKSAKRGEEGEVPIRLEVGTAGELLSLTVLDESLASRRLIKAAIKAVEKSAPFPDFAPEMGHTSAVFEVKIFYKLR